MKKVQSSCGKEIGAFDGVRVRDFDNKVIYQVVDGEVYSPCEHIDADLQHFNKGGWAYMGKLQDRFAHTDQDEVIFEIV